MKSYNLLLLAVTIMLLSSSCKKDPCESPNDTKTVTMQPGPKDGQDCIVAIREGDGGLNANTNHNPNPDINASTWTYGAHGWGVGTNRTYIKFSGLSYLPQNAVILSAKISLFGGTSSVASPQGNSNYPGSPYNSHGSNKCWLKAVTGNWDETTITWNNKPGTTEQNKVEIPASNSQWGYNAIDLDVTAMVKTMVAENKNYGFALMQQTEQYYRNLVFLGGSSAEAAKRPKLVVNYQLR